MLCGIDEAGRGPIAGDLVVAGCILHKPIAALDDSKRLSPKKREQLYEIIIATASYHVVIQSPKKIDALGLSYCLAEALQKIKRALNAKRYLFDGNTAFGVEGIETMVRADAKVAEVSAASIIAKVVRDRRMLRMHKRYTQYEFDRHKGYITKRHIELIRKYGYSDIHRKSYKVKALEGIV